MHPDKWPPPPYIVYSVYLEKELGETPKDAQPSIPLDKKLALEEFADLTNNGHNSSNQRIEDSGGNVIFSATNPKDIRYIQDNFKP